MEFSYINPVLVGVFKDVWQTILELYFGGQKHILHSGVNFSVLVNKMLFTDKKESNSCLFLYGSGFC